MSDFSDDAQREYGEALAEGKMDKPSTPNPVPTLEQEKMRDEILSIPVDKFKDGSPMYLEDVFPNIVEADFADQLLALFESHLNRAVVEARKQGFYAGQAMTGAELKNCHNDWERWNMSDEEKAKIKTAKFIEPEFELEYPAPLNSANLQSKEDK